MPLNYMVSYAQNFEDVMLRRALQSVAIGFYVDLGAQDPIDDSVTKHFYDHGWRGINVEPNPFYFQRLQQHRPGDTNIAKAISTRTGKTSFIAVENSGLSSLDASVQSLAAKHGLRSREIEVELIALNDVIASHPLPDIHFMKVDVEGAEAEALSSIDLTKTRPWIILVEATLPTLPTPNWHTFEHLLLGRGYHDVYFDGLNKWYVRDESAALDSYFNIPPNPFDYFERWREAAWRRREAENAAAKKAPGFGALFGGQRA
jgi:FkbM family methyltransferase